MNKFIAAMATVSAMAIAAPAAAQYPGQQNGYRASGQADANLSARIDQLQVRLQAGVQSGSITRREAMSLRQQLRQLGQLERQYARGGISGRERGELQRRMREVRQAIRAADGNHQARWDGYDREDGYGRYDQYGIAGGYGGSARVDADRDRYDDRDRRWDDDESEGRFQQAQPGRRGLGGIVDSLLGGGGLRIGQRATADLYGLQGSYRDQYRDGGGTYYRTDGRLIYQIDARSQTVVRVHPMRR